MPRKAVPIGQSGPLFIKNKDHRNCGNANGCRRYNQCMDLTLPELEQAINYWRARRPSVGEEHALSPEVNALATVYALMIFNHARTIPFDSLDSSAQQLLEAWRGQTA